ncbi:MAG: lamin tail domain-containing protein [Myxococcota bacterium]
MGRLATSLRFSGLSLFIVAACFACGAPDSSAPHTEETSSLAAKLNPNPKLSDLVLGAANSIRLRTGVVIDGGGDVAALGSGAGPFLSGNVAVDIGSGSKLPTSRNVIADSIRLGTGAVVGDLQTNRLIQGSGAVRGSVSALVPLPALPAAAPVTAATNGLTVKTGATLSVSPGRFGSVSVGSGATLRLASGTYEFGSLKLSTSARLEALGPVQIRVAGRLVTGTGSFVGAAPSVSLAAASVRLEISGQNGNTGALGEAPVAASIGTGAVVAAIVLVPNGTLTFGTGVIARGAFLARDIDVGSGANLTFEGGFVGPACNETSCEDGNPCTIDTCSAAGVCNSVVASDGTTCSDGDACTQLDVCQTGVCVGNNLVTCSASDVCHAAGVCDPATGICSNPQQPVGTSCGEGLACDVNGVCVGIPRVVINEVESSGGSPGDWVELYNAGNGPADLSGYRFLDNDNTHTAYVIPAGTILPSGGYFTLDEAVFGFGLGGADSARLFDSNGTVVDSYTWSAHATTTYGRCPDGGADFATTAASTKGAPNSCGTGGGGSGGAGGAGGVGGTGGGGNGGGGTNGGTGGTGAGGASLVINEIESSNGTPGDWVELYNPGTTNVDVSGWRFLDNDDTHVAYVVPAGSVVAPGGYFLLEEASFGFGLGGADSVRLYDASGTLIETHTWSAHAATSYGRCPSGTGTFTTTTSVTKGAPNDCTPAVKINEVESSGGTPGDWIELYNAGVSSIDMSGWTVRDNDDTHAYTIPAGTLLAPASYYVVEEAALGFGLGSGDSARIYDPQGTLIDSYVWTAHATTTYGRCPNGNGAFITTVAASKGLANDCPGAPRTWPGSTNVTTVDATGAFPSNLSGLFYEPASGSAPGASAALWAVRNDPGTLYRLVWNGAIWTPDLENGWSAGKPVRYPDGSGNPDSEGVTRAELADSAIYIATERNNQVSGTSRLSILRFDLTQSGSELIATHEWNLTADLPIVGSNLGLEAITFVPDSFLVSRSFLDEARSVAYDPSAYPNHGSGLFFVGVEGTGLIYAYALDHLNGTFQRIATIQSGSVAVMDLQFDRDNAQLWTYCDDTCGNVAGVLSVDTNTASTTFGKFILRDQYARPAAMPNINNEGIAFASEAECVAGTKPFFWSDDSATDGHALRSGMLQCGAL